MDYKNIFIVTRELVHNLGVMIDEFYMSSNSQHVNNVKEYENFHGCTFVDVQVLNGVHIEQKKKFM
jgi:hypothetical protein